MNIDEIIRNKQKSISYDLRSYSISSLIDMFQNGDIYIPSYQRLLIWNKKSQSNFIESMIIGLPTPSLFFATTEDFRYEILDGVQRLKSLEAFVNDDLVLTGLESIEELNGMRFNELPSTQRRKFLMRSLSVISLSPDTTLESRKEIFVRMNSMGSSKTVSEIRTAVLNEGFHNLITELSVKENFLRLINLSDFYRSRKENEDLVIRFYCLSNHIDKYKGNMNTFLDKVSKSVDENSDLELFESEFNRTVIFVSTYFPDLFIKSKYKFNKSLFDAIFVGSCLALRDNPQIQPYNLSWVMSEEFNENLKMHATQTNKRVKERIMFVKSNLLSED
ncbi:TPA: DUF262 domain-containing protein [Photobacterium damselae]